MSSAAAPQPISDPAMIDLDRHAIIEASAGTGKTYTITALVMRLLERGVAIEKILIVTFTEKASAELRDRIRAAITQRYAEDPQPYLKTALESFINAAIFTIHGFCQRVLRERAFENRTVFDLQLVDDTPLYRAQFNAIKRQWPARADIAGELARVNYGPQWQADILRIAQGVDLDHDGFAPDFAREQEHERCLNDQLALLREYDYATVEAEFAAMVTAKKTPPAAWEKNRDEFLLPLMDALRGVECSRESFAALVASWGGKGFKKALLRRYTAKMLESFADQTLNLHRFIDEVQKGADALAQLEAIARSRFSHATIIELKQRVKRFKRDNGLISFDDMIDDLYTILRDEQGGGLRSALQEQFSCALIDEFQDTDLKQWAIFKSLFVGSDDHTLMLIADSKQAIYGFRGADVNAFFRARAELLELAAERVSCYRLAINYRSTAALLDEFNMFWGETFYPADEAAVEKPSTTISAQNGPAIIGDSSGFAPITVLDNGAAATSSYALKMQLADSIASAIEQLEGRFSFMLKGSERNLTLADICVLVRSKSEAQILERRFRQRGIASSFYKKPGIFESDEASAFLFLLQYLGAPERVSYAKRVLLSGFFGLQIDQLSAFDAGAFPRLHELMAELLLYSSRRQWPRFFQSLREKSPIFYRASREQQWRCIANLTQIATELERAAIEKNLDAESLARELHNWQVNSRDEDNHQKETEKPTVKMMTIHASKGLEFPVVFLYGGFSAKNYTASYYRYCDHESRQTIYDLGKSPANRAAHDAKIAEEDRRLYYVAFTRAVFKLFLPCYEATRSMRGPYSSLVNGEVARLRENFAPATTAAGSVAAPAAGGRAELACSFTPLQLDLSRRATIVNSFSSLSHLYHQDTTALTYGSSVEYRDDALDLKTEEPREELELPHGAQTGNILHNIFETIDFARVGRTPTLAAFVADEELMAVIDSSMDEFKLRDLQRNGASYRGCFAALVFNTLTKRIAALDDLRLADIAADQRKHELEFMLDYRGEQLTGFIDLLFRLDGRYYILDWKSNFSANGYTPAVLEQEMMQSHNYNLQYELYALALRRWFDSLGIAAAQLGGALYIFSRGMDAASETQEGIFFDAAIGDAGDDFIELAQRRAEQ